MDNTVRENKNRNVAALCNWLVSIGICDVIHLVFLPVGHTHERVDHIFSRISIALSRSSAYTIEAFLDLVAKAFSPTPEISELSFSLDFSEWLRPHFQDHIQDISKPHKFEFTRDDAAASGGSLRTALWSNTPLSEPVHILKSAPTGTPEIRAGRPLLYALCDKKKPDAVKVQRYLDDFKKVRSYITDLEVQWHFSPVERESWKNLLDDLDETQTAPSAAFSGFWPQRKEEVDDFLREHGQTAPAEARHTMATNADLNNAEAARVEAEVRAQVLEDDSAFRGVHAGAKERLHDNTSPSDAKGSNLVVIDVSDVHEEDKCPETLGDWESRFVIGLVKSRETTEDTLTVAVYEPFHADAKGKPVMPLWLYAQAKGGKKPVDTSWEKCLTLPWKLVEAAPLSYAKAIHDASGSREVFNEDGTMLYIFQHKCAKYPSTMSTNITTGMVNTPLANLARKMKPTLDLKNVPIWDNTISTRDNAQAVKISIGSAGYLNTTKGKGTRQEQMTLLAAMRHATAHYPMALAIVNIISMDSGKCGYAAWKALLTELQGSAMEERKRLEEEITACQLPNEPIQVYVRRYQKLGNLLNKAHGQWTFEYVATNYLIPGLHPYYDHIVDTTISAAIVHEKMATIISAGQNMEARKRQRQQRVRACPPNIIFYYPRDPQHATRPNVGGNDVMQRHPQPVGFVSPAGHQNKGHRQANNNSGQRPTGYKEAYPFVGVSPTAQHHGSLPIMLTCTTATPGGAATGAQEGEASAALVSHVLHAEQGVLRGDPPPTLPLLTADPIL
eukprot:jgi/Tetstr1/432910/TSEL_022250.t1